ncbi:hypothetical protein ACM16X_02765 [Haloarcula japonica]|uniref:hypothetical protein n=1 Tax=Haloarcula japonica TaxID=29282 RepID=UPI0039F72CAB
MTREIVTKIVLPVLLVVLFLVLAFTDFFVVIHELGHWSFCGLQGGEPVFKELAQGPAVQCHGVESVWDRSNYVLFYVGGILAEISLASAFLISSYTRDLGVLTWFKVAGSYSLAGTYSHDISAVVESADWLFWLDQGVVKSGLFILVTSATMTYFISILFGINCVEYIKGDTH